MNYETTMDLSGAPNTRVEEIEIDGSSVRRRRIVIAVVAAVVLLAVAAYIMSRGADGDKTHAPSAGNTPCSLKSEHDGRSVF